MLPPKQHLNEMVSPYRCPPPELQLLAALVLVSAQQKPPRAEADALQGRPGILPGRVLEVSMSIAGLFQLEAAVNHPSGGHMK